MKKLILSALVAIALVSCEEKKDSVQITEAISIHQNMKAVHSELNGMLDVQYQRYEAFVEMVSESGDSSTLVALANAGNIINGLQSELSDWDTELVEIPGHCFHEEGEAHEHDHAEEARLAKLSDQEILDIQKELDVKLKEIEVKVRSLEQK
jgi:hypothetical protein